MVNERKNNMTESTETEDQTACSVEKSPTGVSSGVRAMTDRAGKY